MQQLPLILCQLRRSPVKALTLLDFIKTQTEDYYICLFCQNPGIDFQHFILLAVTVKALRIADDIQP